MSETSTGVGRGRPSTGARERLLSACLELLKRDGYSGLTTAKVAEMSGANKALISYYFGSKEGMVGEVAATVSRRIGDEFLEGLGQPRTAEELAIALVDGFWGLAERNHGLIRAYFNLASTSIVEPGVREILRATRAEQRGVLIGLLEGLDDGPAAHELEAVAIYLIAVLEGLSLERLERGESPTLQMAREMFTDIAAVAIRDSASPPRDAVDERWT